MAETVITAPELVPLLSAMLQRLDDLETELAELRLEKPGSPKPTPSDLITNISGTGVLVRSSTPIAVGDDITLEFTLDDAQSTRSFNLKAVARRFDTRPDPKGRHGTGCEFSELSVSERDELVRFIMDRHREDVRIRPIGR